MSLLRFGFYHSDDALSGARTLWDLLTEGDPLPAEVAMLEDRRHPGWLDGLRRSGVYLTLTPAALHTWDERRVLGRNGCIVNIGAVGNSELDPKIVAHLKENMPYETAYIEQTAS